jgi:hypothetical protein
MYTISCGTAMKNPENVLETTTHTNLLFQQEFHPKMIFKELSSPSTMVVICDIPIFAK